MRGGLFQCVEAQNLFFLTNNYFQAFFSVGCLFFYLNTNTFIQNTDTDSSSCVFSVTAEEPETRQHCDFTRHHPHRTVPDAGLWVSREYFHEKHQHILNTLCDLWTFWLSSQDSDLKQYLDNCGNLMSMHNVKVSHKQYIRELVNELSNCFSRVLNVLICCVWNPPMLPRFWYRNCRANVHIVPLLARLKKNFQTSFVDRTAIGYWYIINLWEINSYKLIMLIFAFHDWLYIKMDRVINASTNGLVNAFSYHHCRLKLPIHWKKIKIKPEESLIGCLGETQFLLNPQKTLVTPTTLWTFLLRVKVFSIEKK